jgi:hypothetical protein
MARHIDLEESSREVAGSLLMLVHVSAGLRYGVCNSFKVRRRRSVTVTFLQQVNAWKEREVIFGSGGTLPIGVHGLARRGSVMQCVC